MFKLYRGNGDSWFRVGEKFDTIDEYKNILNTYLALIGFKSDNQDVNFLEDEILIDYGSYANFLKVQGDTKLFQQLYLKEG